MKKLISASWTGAVDLSRDPNGPPLEDLFPIIDRIQKSRKRVVFHGEFNHEEIQKILEIMNPDGLCLLVVTETVEEANDLLSPFIS